jgi:hypothetical protein
MARTAASTSSVSAPLSSMMPINAVTPSPSASCSTSAR